MNDLSNDYFGRAFWHPMTHPAEPYKTPAKIISKAEGVHITDGEGKRVLDALAGGLWNVNLGFSCDPVKEAIAKQLTDLPYYSAFRGTVSDKTIELSHELMEWLGPDGMARAFFTSGGSDSVETALRLARQYHKLKGQGDRTKFISLRNSYHGTHFGGASINGNARFKRQYEPLLPGCFNIPAPWPYRNPFGETDPERLAQLCAEALEAEIAFQSPDTVAAFIMEPVLGAGGVIPPHPSFMPLCREICDRHGVLMIADEVITGFGRTGSWTGSRHWGVKPDMMSIAKALTNGYFPMGACMISEEVAEVFESNRDQMGMIGHGYTYSGHPVGAAAALAALAETKRLKVNENAAERGAELHEALQGLMAKHDLIGDVRGGVGLMHGVELVSHRASKTPIDKATMERIFERIYEAGVIVRTSGNLIVLSPSLIITSEHVGEIVAAIDHGLSA